MRTLLAAAFIALPGSVAAADIYVGEVRTFVSQYCPSGFIALNGQLLSIDQNQALFQLIGTTYGGDGRSNFAMPMAKPIYTATGAYLLQCMATTGIYP